MAPPLALHLSLASLQHWLWISPLIDLMSLDVLCTDLSSAPFTFCRPLPKIPYSPNMKRHIGMVKWTRPRTCYCSCFAIPVLFTHVLRTLSAILKTLRIFRAGSRRDRHHSYVPSYRRHPFKWVWYDSGAQLLLFELDRAHFLDNLLAHRSAATPYSPVHVALYSRFLLFMPTSHQTTFSSKRRSMIWLLLIPILR